MSELTPENLDELEAIAEDHLLRVGKPGYTLTSLRIRESMKTIRSLILELRKAWKTIETLNRINEHYARVKAAKCTSCGVVGPGDSSWRFNGEHWEHKCPDKHPQAGHFRADSIDVAELVKETERLRKDAAALLVAKAHHVAHTGDGSAMMDDTIPCMLCELAAQIEALP